MDIPSLDTFSTVAGIGAAIAIAYAGLPNFRYKERVLNHIRSLLTTALVNALLEDYEAGGAICATGCYSMIFKLGSFDSWKCPPEIINNPEAKIPEPGTPKSSAEKKQQFLDGGFHFEGWIGFIKYHLYNWLFANNLDKRIAIFLGAFSVSVVWFGALDRWHFSDDTIIDAYQRSKYLTGILYWYISLSIIPILGFLYYNCRFFNVKAWRVVKLLLFAFVFTSFIQASINHPFWAKYFGFQNENFISIIIISFLLLSIIIPILLLLGGGSLSIAVNNQGKKCVEMIVLLIDEKAGTAPQPTLPNNPTPPAP